MPTHEIALVPRDGFFVKDGRGWHTSASGRGHSLDWPFPPTLLGALRTSLGRAMEQGVPGARFDGAAFRRETVGASMGPVVPLRRLQGQQAWEPEHRMWPVPMDALYLSDAGKVQRLQPRQPAAPTLGRDEDPAREALWTATPREAKPESAPRWWTEGDFLAWLGEGTVKKHGDLEKRALELPRRVDIRLGIDAETFTAREGMLFSSDTIEPLSTVDGHRWEWAIGLSAFVPIAAPIDSVPWTIGGDRRLARPQPVQGLFEAPTAMAFAGGARGLRLVVVTPACFQNGWLPDGFSSRGGAYRGEIEGVAGDLVLRAAFVPRPEHVSGWDMALNQPKPTLRLVRPGAVYFFEKVSGDAFSAEELRSLWLAAIGARSNEGLGRVVPGRWTPGNDGMVDEGITVT